jgi:hypothetical protein
MTGTIVEYDNDSDNMVVKITAHSQSSLVGKYQKGSWQLVDSTHMRSTGYTMEDTQQLARDSNTVTWGPTPLFTKQ